MNNNLLSQIKNTVATLLTSYPVKIAYIYGSYATGKETEKSDLDVAIVFGREIEAKKRLSIELEISSVFSKQLGLTCDVRSIDDAPLKVIGEILTEGILIYSSDEDYRVDFETSFRDKYFDFKPALDFMRKMYFRSIKEKGLYG